MDGHEGMGMRGSGTERETVVRQYLDGVEAIVRIAGSLPYDAWSRSACGSWDAADTVRHVLAVSRWYDEWLDRALTGATTAPFGESAIDRLNEENIRALRNLDGSDAVVEFQQTALAYVERAVEHWVLPYSYPFGRVTVGLHLGVAAAEWHLHAFDLAAAAGQVYEPSDAHALFLVAGTCVAETKPFMQKAFFKTLVPLGARFKPWQTMLRESGRR
jgi:hypothetical protein